MNHFARVCRRGAGNGQGRYVRAIEADLDSNTELQPTEHKSHAASASEYMFDEKDIFTIKDVRNTLPHRENTQRSGHDKKMHYSYGND